MASTKYERSCTSRAGVELEEKIDVEDFAAQAAQEFSTPAAATRSRRGARDFTWTAFQVVNFQTEPGETGSMHGRTSLPSHSLAGKCFGIGTHSLSVGSGSMASDSFSASGIQKGNAGGVSAHLRRVPERNITTIEAGIPAHPESVSRCQLVPKSYPRPHRPCFREESTPLLPVRQRAAWPATVSRTAEPDMKSHQAPGPSEPIFP